MTAIPQPVPRQDAASGGQVMAVRAALPGHPDIGRAETADTAPYRCDWITEPAAAAAARWPARTDFPGPRADPAKEQRHARPR